MSENIIKRKREELGLSQSQFARLSGVNFRTLQDYEQGRKPVTSAKGEVLYRISSALGCSVEEILLESGDFDTAGVFGRVYQYSVLLDRMLEHRQGIMIHTPFDDVFRTLVVDCRSLLIPLVNLAFGEDYDESALVELKQNEHISDLDSGETVRRASDSNFVILERNGIRKSYQLECQSRVDSSILLRLFEYATAVAMEGGEVSEHKVTITYPRSALIYLRHTKNTPEEMEIVLDTPGGTVNWKVPVLKSQEYSIDDIFEKHLYMLIPFYLLTHERDLDQAERVEAERRKLRGEYEKIFRRLEEANEEGYLNTYQMITIRNLSKTICEHLTTKYSRVKKELTEVMGGRVLDYEAKDILNRGIRQGVSQGISQGINMGIQVLIDTCRELDINFEVTAAKLKSKFNLSDAEVRENMERYWK